MTKSKLTHDIHRGVLNGVEFNLDLGLDPQMMRIPTIPCERCGAPVYLGIITSSCGDTAKDVWVEYEDCYEDHECGVQSDDDLPECPVCFPSHDDRDAEEMDMASVAR